MAGAEVAAGVAVEAGAAVLAAAAKAAVEAVRERTRREETILEVMSGSPFARLWGR
jgi:hypothetical protein